MSFKFPVFFSIPEVSNTETHNCMFICLSDAEKKDNDYAYVIIKNLVL